MPSEIDPPKDVERVEWILLTSLPVASFNDAWRILEYYEKRWLIEEYHKALKTGCRVESRQLQSKEGLERITALLSVVAVRLLQLKSAARTQSRFPARHLVPLHWIKMLLAARKRSKLTVAMTIRRILPRGGQTGRFPRAQIGRRARLDHHLARLAEVVHVRSWCGTRTNNQINVGKSKAS